VIDLLGGGEVRLERTVYECERQKVDERTEREIGAFKKCILLPNILSMQLNMRME
jgi:hypothetical protein